MPKLYKRAAARRDLVEHAVYLAAEGGEELAERFLSQAHASCTLLLDQPEIGSPLLVRDPDLVGIRKWPVKDFENFLIFYLPHQRGVTIVRGWLLRGSLTAPARRLLLGRRWPLVTSIAPDSPAV